MHQQSSASPSAESCDRTSSATRSSTVVVPAFAEWALPSKSSMRLRGYNASSKIAPTQQKNTGLQGQRIRNIRKLKTKLLLLNLASSVNFLFYTLRQMLPKFRRLLVDVAPDDVSTFPHIMCSVKARFLFNTLRQTLPDFRRLLVDVVPDDVSTFPQIVFRKSRISLISLV